MTDETIRALARVNKYLWGVLEADGALMTDVRRGNYERMPALGFQQMQREVISRHAMDDDVVDMMSALVDCLDVDDLSLTDSLPPTRQGIYDLEWLRFKDFRTMSVKDAADELGVSTQRVYALVSEGKLLAVEIRGRKMLFRHQVERRKMLSDK